MIADRLPRTVMTVRLPAAVLAAVLLTAACSSGATSPVDVPQPSTGSRSATPVTPTPSAPPPPPSTPPPPPAPEPEPVSQLTGEAPQSGAPLVAVKIDNAPLALPFHEGLGAAAMVYVELVEAGTTRFVALYQGAPDLEVGPVRSARSSDIELLEQYGSPVLAYSGANSGVLEQVRASMLTDAGKDLFRGAYRKAGKRKDAFNFYVRPSQLATIAPGGTGLKDVGLRFGPLPPGGEPVTSLRARFSERTSFRIRYDEATQRYDLSTNGKALAGAAPANVIVQRVQVRPGAFADINGSPSPETVTTGLGEAIVLRDGALLRGSWSRPDAVSGTRFLDSAGNDLPLHPGPTWVLLVPTDQSVTPG